MPRSNIVVGLDVGTSTVYTVVGQKREDTSVPQILGIGAAQTAGMRQGIIIDADEVTSSIRSSVAAAQRSSGIEIKEVYVNVGGSHIECMPSHGVVAVSRADQEISVNDVDRVLAAAEAVHIPANRELLDVIAHEFIVDGEGGIKDPVGMNGVRLEVEALLVWAASPHLRTLQRCVASAGLKAVRVIPTAFASARAVLTKRQKELGVVCLDIGGGTTNLAVYEEGDLLHAVVLPIGSAHITNDLAIGLRVPVDVAEQIKKEYGLALAREAAKRETIDLADLDPHESGTVLRKDIAEIAEARLSEIFDLANKELRKIQREAFLPGGVVLVGGGVKTSRIVDLAKERMRLPVQIGFPQEVEGVVDSVDDPAFAAALGLVFYGFDETEWQGSSYIGLASMNDTVQRMRRWMRAFLP